MAGNCFPTTWALTKEADKEKSIRINNNGLMAKNLVAVTLKLGKSGLPHGMNTKNVPAFSVNDRMRV
jgi:hypothetical protein